MEKANAVHKEKEITVPHGKDAERTSPPRRYLLKATSAFSKYAAVRWAQSELFFRLLLKNTVCSPQITAYANFLEGIFTRIPCQFKSKIY